MKSVGIPGFDDDSTRLVAQVVSTSNEAMLQASRQGSLLAAAIISTTPFWIERETAPVATTIALWTLIASIMCSGICHFTLGFIDLLAVSRLLRNDQKKARRSLISNKPLAIGGLQLLLLCGGLAAFAFVTASVNRL